MSPFLPIAQNQEESKEQIVLHPVTVVRENGTVEKAYVEAKALDRQIIHTRHFAKHLYTIYLFVGIVALGLTVYISIDSIRSKH